MTVPNVARIAASIRETCERVGRDPSSVKLLAVAKEVPPETIRQAVDAGITLFGENRVQEARDKSAQGAFTGATICLIGHLQSNKASLAARIFDEVHSVDSERLAAYLGSSSLRYRRSPLPVLVEVNAAEDPAKFGVAPSHALELVRAVIATPGLRLRGLMTVAPGQGDEALSRAAFRRLRFTRDELLDAGVAREYLSELSMGMSGDYVVAIEEGSTIVRIGTALFGPRRAR